MKIKPTYCRSTDKVFHKKETIQRLSGLEDTEALVNGRGLMALYGRGQIGHLDFSGWFNLQYICQY